MGRLHNARVCQALEALATAQRALSDAGDALAAVFRDGRSENTDATDGAPEWAPPGLILRPRQELRLAREGKVESAKINAKTILIRTPSLRAYVAAHARQRAKVAPQTPGMESSPEDVERELLGLAITPRRRAG